jgi:hypothetical protein
LLRKAEELHLSALDLAVRAFGEQNVQTSKHYGNLGRLYQVKHDYRCSLGATLKIPRLYFVVLENVN